MASIRSLTRRSLASLVLASALICAPLASTAAFAENEPAVVETPIVETPPETSADEAPADETPADETSADETPAAETTASGDEQAPSDDPAAEPALSARAGAAALTTAAAYTCDYSPQEVTHFSFCVDASADGQTGTAFWEPNDPYGQGYYVEVYDVTSNWTLIVTQFTRDTALTFTTVPGHELHIYAHNFDWGNALFFTAASLAPEAPTALEATRSTGANAIDLAWLAPTSNPANPVVGYTVRVSSTAGLLSTSSTTSTAFTASGLIAGTQYTFTVVAVGQNGETSAASSTTATLDVIAPTAARDVILTVTGETLSASWTAPAYDGGSSPVGYRTDLFADDEYIMSYGGTSTSLTLNETAAFGVEYRVEVFAYNLAGEAAPALSTTVERPDAVLAAPVAYATAYGYKDARIYVTWDLAAASGSPAHSVVVTLYDAVGAQVQQQTISLAGNRTGMEFTGLPNDTEFAVTVAAVNLAGTSPESAAAAVTTMPLEPPAYSPEDLATVSPYSQITVSFTGTELSAYINGATPGDWVFGHAYSTPVALGWVQVDATGTARWSISGAGLAPGVHTLAVQDAFGGIWGSATFQIAAPAAAAAPAALAHAGADSSSWILIALALLALGILSTVRASRRAARA